jgi:RNA polymerase sigma-70 factor (ECF subfamily)
MADERAFAQLVPPLAPAMLRVAVALVGRADAEDATQEAILHAWQSWSTLRDVRAVRSWLLRVTVNVCRQWRRGSLGQQRRLTESLPYDGDGLLAALDADPGTTAHVAALDVRRVLNRLDEDLRLIVVLRYYGGMDATEIGEALSMSPATVRTKLRRALVLLRQKLEAGDHDASSRAKGGDAHAT